MHCNKSIKILNYGRKYILQVKKRKRNEVTRNNEGKYQCQHCDYEAKWPSNLTKHVEAIHEGVRYPCNQCSYKATETGNLQSQFMKVYIIHVANVIIKQLLQVI